MSLEISKARARIPWSTLCARRQKINASSWEIEPLCPTWFCLLAAVHLCYLINFSLSLYFNTFEDTAFKHDLILLYRYGIDPSDVTFEQFPKDLIRIATAHTSYETNQTLPLFPNLFHNLFNTNTHMKTLHLEANFLLTFPDLKRIKFQMMSHIICQLSLYPLQSLTTIMMIIGDCALKADIECLMDYIL